MEKGEGENRNISLALLMMMMSAIQKKSAKKAVFPATGVRVKRHRPSSPHLQVPYTMRGFQFKPRRRQESIEESVTEVNRFPSFPQTFGFGFSLPPI